MEVLGGGVRALARWVAKQRQHGFLRMRKRAQTSAKLLNVGRVVVHTEPNSKPVPAAVNNDVAVQQHLGNALRGACAKRQEAAAGTVRGQLKVVERDLRMGALEVHQELLLQCGHMGADVGDGNL